MKHTGFSICDRCGKRWPSAAPDVIHKCQCSGGICSYEYTEEGDVLEEYIALAEKYADARDWSGAYCVMKLAFLELLERHGL